MDSFSSESRSAVQEAFNTLRHTIGRELENELKKKLQKDAESREYLNDELEILRSRSAEADRLEEDNRSLRAKFLRLNQQGRTTESPRATPAPKPPTCDNATNTDPEATGVTGTEGDDRETILRESQKVLKKYIALDKNFKTLMASYKKEKDDKKKWEEYAKSLESKLKRLEGRSGKSAESTHSTESAPEPPRPRSTVSPGFTAGLGAELRETDEPAEGLGAARNGPRASLAPHKETRALSVPDSTEGDSTESGKDAEMPTLPPLKRNVETADVHIKAELSSDGVEVVSERYVGKRKHAGDATDGIGRQRIKIESSDMSTSLPPTQIQESMDLDEIGPRVTTPKRNRHVDVGRAKTTEPVFVRPDNISTPVVRPSNSSTVLTPVNPNVRPVRPYEKMTVDKPPKKGLAQGIGSLAEDGLPYSTSGRGAPFRTPQAPRRLETLLNNPSPDKAPAIVRSAPRLRDPNPLVADELAFPDRRQLPFNKDRRDKSKESSLNRRVDDGEEEEAGASPMRGSSKSRAAIEKPLTPAKAPLRSKPVSALRLDDFKVNPKFNDGSDYAYSEVVRGHDRAGLPGCTDMNCCGPKFRAMALAQKNSPDRTSASDSKLFEDYLGDRISSILGMSKAEKEELWVKAKTWQLANELGKHRHRSSRGRSLQTYNSQAGRMNNRHLPAGQAMPGGGGPGAGVGDMGGPGGGNRRRMQQQPYAHYQQQYQQMPMYPTSWNPYAAAAPYYHQLPHQYQNGGMPSGYMHYPQQQPYVRSPQAMPQPQYVPMAGVSVPQPYSQPSQPSPALSNPYQPPPVPAALHVQSPPPPQPQPVHQTPAEPSVMTPVAEPFQPSAEPFQPAAEPFEPVAEAQPSTPAPETPLTPQSQELPFKPFRAPLPWTPPTQGPFPKRTAKSRRRRRLLSSNAIDITLPVLVTADKAETDVEKTGAKNADNETEDTSAKPAPSDRSATSVSNESSPKAEAPKESARPTTSSSNTSRPAVPVVPVVPVIPKSSPKEAKPASISKPEEVKEPTTEEKPADVSETADAAGTEPKVEAQPAAPVKVAPKTWSGLFSAAAAAANKAQPNANGPTTAAPANGAIANGAGAVNGGASNFPTNANSLAAAIQDFRVGSLSKVQFIEPRGLINTGNMCYMNSVLQVLLFCGPFYDFLDQVSKKAVHKFKSSTPVTDAMIMFMREFRVIESTDSVDKLRKKLKNEQLEQYGDSFIPEFVYKAIQPLPAFASMRRGHQQDAQEFLGLILTAIGEECAQVMSSGGSTNAAPDVQPVSSAASVAESQDGADGWFEVGSRQRAVETRSSGASQTTPITRLFNGQYRSELRRPGVKDSVNMEPFQSLQLDIGAPYINNVLDAIKGLTLPERLQGDAGPMTKQLLIETLPPILILHLKRFKFDTEGTTKIGKKVGYPLDLQLPAEVLSKRHRNAILAEGAGLPKYKLIGVVYHHGKQANGGHYTVDVRRQDENEWIRLDDTVIRRVRSEDVAEAGAEEEVKDSSRQGASSRDASANRFGAMADEDEGDGWKEVTTSAKGGDKNEKKWSAVANGNGAGTAPKGKPAKDNIKDNKVAYLLFYQRV
ncbi:ubiquitin carboxyl-terminal hydrolase [Colletotrichum karsti]|uniref:ubiquitinyl hydrolase 1 n=1 Tax=Colletotrichum karsti TaxID=1095194 RepID=A0A9P6LPE1_9PEZI|nr:ubiquitin carboxyl-terminal hydrolase [Colletotrichum karsti]KAF9880740.1 ubiquitin carboxyl-terminal hydrolase [Colletotrichum karsti]